MLARVDIRADLEVLKEELQDRAPGPCWELCVHKRSYYIRSGLPRGKWLCIARELVDGQAAWVVCLYDGDPTKGYALVSSFETHARSPVGHILNRKLMEELS